MRKGVLSILVSIALVFQLVFTPLGITAVHAETNDIEQADYQDQEVVTAELLEAASNDYGSESEADSQSEAVTEEADDEETTESEVADEEAEDEEVETEVDGNLQSDDEAEATNEDAQTDEHTNSNVLQDENNVDTVIIVTPGPDKYFSYQYRFILRGLDESNSDTSFEGNLDEEWHLVDYDGNKVFSLPHGNYELILLDTYADEKSYITLNLEIKPNVDYLNEPLVVLFDLDGFKVLPSLNLQAANITENEIQVKWDELENVESFKINIDYGDTIELDRNQTSYTFKNLQADEKYFIGLFVKYESGLTDYESIDIKTNRLNVENEEVVHIPDEALEQALRNELGVYLRDLTKVDLERMQYFTSNYKGIQDLTGLEYAVNLESLNLAYNEISNLQPLEKLTKLTHIDLHSNDISDISSLEKLSKLQSLYLSSNFITDINPIQDLKNLTHLDLSNNSINDITPLQTLTNLNFLYLSSNKISDLNALKDLKLVRELYLDENLITDVTPISELESLRYVNLSYNFVKNVEPLRNLPNLYEVSLLRNPIYHEQAIETLFEMAKSGLNILAVGVTNIGYVFIEKTTEDSMTIKWEVAVGEFSSDVDRFELLVNDDEKIITLDSDKRSYTLTNLEQGQLYKIGLNIVYENGDVNFIQTSERTELSSDLKNSLEIQLDNFDKKYKYMYEITPIEVFDEYAYFYRGRINAKGQLLTNIGDTTLGLVVGKYKVYIYNNSGEAPYEFELTVDKDKDYVTNPIILNINNVSDKGDKKDDGVEREPGKDSEDQSNKGSDNNSGVKKPDNGSKDKSEGSNKTPEKNSDKQAVDASDNQPATSGKDSVQKVVKVKPTVKENVYTVDTEAIGEIEEDATVVVETSSSKEDLSVKLPKDVVEKLKAANAGLTVTNQEVDVQIPVSILDGESEVIVKPMKVNDSSALAVFDFTIITNGKVKHEFSEKVTLTFNVDSAQVNKPENVKVFYYNEETGEWELIGGEYDPETGTITVTTDHFSTFGVFEVEGQNVVPKGKPLPNTATNTMNTLLVGIVLIAVAGSTLLYSQRKRKTT